MEAYLQVGSIIAPHGLRGDVKVFPTTDDVKRFKKLKKLFLDTGKKKIPLEVQEVRFFKQLVILKFRGLDRIEDVEPYRKCTLWVSRDQAVPLEEDEYFIADLIGMEVFADGEAFGILKDVLETGANQVYVVDSASHGEVLIPAIRQCIQKVDVEGKRMDVHLLNGLLESDDGKAQGQRRQNGGEEA
jgi:16S rRNA processing protein RimM